MTNSVIDLIGNSPLVPLRRMVSPGHALGMRKPVPETFDLLPESWTVSHSEEIRTDNGHESQAKFHWHVEDQGIRHACIKRDTQQLNGKVERSHRSDRQEFYQLLTYKGDVDLEAKLDEWERYYNFARSRDACDGKAPYEALREKQ